TDVRISQVTDLVPVAMADADASEMTMSKCTIQQREVYTKVLKGELMIRKFIRWKTNKESDSDAFPAYVVHYTDLINAEFERSGGSRSIGVTPAKRMFGVSPNSNWDP
ncbi:MAG: hypothetical protein AAF664_22680, partial [Planctomycetota bacterium]